MRECTNSSVSRRTISIQGSIGRQTRIYPQAKINIRLKPSAKPVHTKPYPVPYNREETFKQELKYLVREIVLQKCGTTDWASPIFIIPKMDDRIRSISDFRALTKLIERPQYPLPRIHESMLKQKGYKYFTKIDLSMMFYYFELDEPSKELCTIVTPYGKFQYNRLPIIWVSTYHQM